MTTKVNNPANNTKHLKNDKMETVNQKNIERNYWFVLFGYGDSRSTIYGWSACDKSEYTKSKAKSAGDRVAKRKGESQFNYFIVERTYVTDSPDAFLKKCKSVNLNPNLEGYI